MKTTQIRYNKKEKLSDPILLVGLPGIGNVGSLVGEHLRREFHAKKFAVLYSTYFPHQVIMTKNGGMRMVSNRFYHFQNKNGKSVILLLGDSQAGTPRGQYVVNERIVKFYKKLKGKTIYTIGGYSAGNQYIRNPRVFGSASSRRMKEYLEKAGILFGQTQGSIWGSAGIIPALSKSFGIEGACIMGETGMLDIDANAARSVLEVLKKVLNVDINLDNIDRIKKETEKMIKDMEELSAESPEHRLQTKENVTYIR